MDFLINAVTSMINKMSAVLGSWSWVRDMRDDLNVIQPYLEKANILMPIDTVLTIMSLYVGLQLVLVAYYWITRTINLIRGAG